MKMIRSTPLAALLATGLLLSGCVAVGHHNPLDATSNPEKLKYADVEAHHPDFKEPFLRDGVVSNPAGFRRVVPGFTATQVVQLLGQPLRESQGTRGQEWDYNFKFKMPDSNNYLVCQYKVVFQGNPTAVRETVWRRKQCLDLVSAT
ncbi:outer membrane protein assembly factor BamE domain-containing protein [Variovorax sp. PAMC 28711]|uniref:outer membrane protein assembly factor BamE domain-containing protein n=1 Tax=Variovorax sp. PAMC 28711 TaxID=1795631 RepID=UPI00078E5875|nr:outer membrane protein assembly factor BamE [Variovorax sp. PAMC 28711]AMM25578.1 hypothetical protein AX767_15340 [Variovorax sp. PAMC 28711]